jgi:hypothetical protein
MERLMDAVLAGLRGAARLEALEKEVLLLRERVAKLEVAAPVCVMVDTLVPEHYELKKPFHVLIEPTGEEYVASFLDANLSASGDTQAEALHNLKDIVIGSYEILSRHDPSELGPGPTRELAVLKEFLKETV